MHRGKVVIGGVLALMLTATKTLAVEQSLAGWRGGGDLRARVTYLGEVPFVHPQTANHAEHNQLFNRNRTRVWARYNLSPEAHIHLRLVNEFFWSDRGRDYGDMQEDREPPSELFPDLLYVDIDGLANGNLDLRIGRQEMIYGNGRVILNGTPRDGSRSLFFNAVKATLGLYEEHTVDFLAIYNEQEDSLTINRQSSLDPIERDEMAVGFYGKNNELEQWPLEYYWIYKHEEREESAEFQTIGGRFFPTLGDWSFNLEYAVQEGEQGKVDLMGEMVDASVTYRAPLSDILQPGISAGYYYLSGDDPDAAERNEGWFPVFSRWPQLSELYLYSFVGTAHGVGGWSNLSAPFFGFDLDLSSALALQLRYHILYADEHSGTGNGDKRGDLATVNMSMQFTEKLASHLRLEHLAVGDYYPDDASSDAWFARAHLQYSF